MRADGEIGENLHVYSASILKSLSYKESVKTYISPYKYTLDIIQLSNVITIFSLTV